MLNHRLRKSYYLLFCIIPIVVLLLSPSISFADADRIFKENNKAVVVVITYDEKDNPISQGSGFIVRTDGAIVTNYHVISNAKNIKVKAGDKTLDVEGLIHTDKENDLVILKVKGEKFPVVKLGDIAKVNVGEKIYVISSPQGLENTISDGILSGIRDVEGTNKKILQITAPVSSGSSGGPVFNKDGEVIGVATFIIEEAQNLNFAMPVNLIMDKRAVRKVTALKDAEIEDYKKTAEYWFYLGVAFGDAGMYKKAIEAYQQSIMIEPNHAETHYNLGVAYEKSGMYKEAIEAYKQAIKIMPDYAEALYNLGTTYSKLDLNKDAVEALKQAIRIKPDYAKAHYNLGIVYENLGMYREAIEAYKQAIRVKPDYAKAHNNLGVVYSRDLGMYKEAIKAYKQTIKITPDDVDAHYNLGTAYGKSGMYKEAIEAFKQAINIKPDYAAAHNNLGIAYYKLGMYKGAIEAYKQAIRIKPDLAEPHLGLGKVYSGLDMYREAVEALKQAIRIKPDLVEAHYGLGLMYLFLNDRGAALDEYRILKDLDPQSANKLFNLIYK